MGGGIGAGEACQDLDDGEEGCVVETHYGDIGIQWRLCDGESVQCGATALS